jgi:hypothetical protein
MVRHEERFHAGAWMRCTGSTADATRSRLWPGLLGGGSRVLVERSLGRGDIAGDDRPVAVSVRSWFRRVLLIGAARGCPDRVGRRAASRWLIEGGAAVGVVAGGSTPVVGLTRPRLMSQQLLRPLPGLGRCGASAERSANCREGRFCRACCFVWQGDPVICRPGRGRRTAHLPVRPAPVTLLGGGRCR